MQTTPISPADPKAATPATGSKTGGKTTPGGQFRQHLTNAGKNTTPEAKLEDSIPTEIVSSAQQKVEQKDSVSAEVTPATEQLDTAMETSEDFFSIAAREFTQTLLAQQGQQADLLDVGTSNLVGTTQNPQTSEDLSNIAASEFIQSLLAQQGQQADLLDGGTSQPAGTTQNQQILSLSDSIQIPGAPGSLELGEKPTITLSTLLKENIALINTQQESGASTSMTAATKPSSGRNNDHPDLTIENWRAQFSYQRATNLQDTKMPTIATNQTQNLGEGVIKEPILYVTPELEQVVAPSKTTGGSGVIIPNERQNTNSNFIHSNLPGITTKAEANETNNGQQQTGEGQQKMTQEGTSQPEQTTVTKAGQNTPLIFSLNQEGTLGFTTASQQTSASQVLRLPSGAEVPQSQVVDQVINHFTLNRTLQSGSITMKLHPAELGELRMEIKVEQDNIRAHITTQNPQVQEILDRHLPKLREALEQQGLNLDHMEVTVATDKDNNAQHFQEHFNQQQESRSTRSKSNRISFALEQEDLETKDSYDEQQSLNVLI